MSKTTKKRKIISIVILSLALFVSLTLLCACDATGKKYDHLVTFDYNVGDAYKQENNLTDRSVRLFLGVADNSLVGLKPGARNDFASIAFKGYYCDNTWYLPETDANGEVIKNADGVVELGEEWDFSSMRVTKDITLYANLVHKVQMNFVDSETGEVVKTITDGEPGKVYKRPSTRQQPAKENFTLYDYYADPECTEKFAWPYTFESEDVTVYVKFISGNWSVVRTAKEFVSALGGNIYVDADIDFAAEKTKWTTPETLNTEIAGNGHTLSNIEIKHTFNKNNFAYCALFGSLGEKANIHDVTFSNVHISAEVTLSGEYNLAMLACSAVGGAKANNVKVYGTIECKYGSFVGLNVAKWINDIDDNATVPAPDDIESAVTVLEN